MKRSFTLAFILVLGLSLPLAGCSGGGSPQAAASAPATTASSSAASTTPASQPAPAGWEPGKNIEWVVTSSPGGGSDIFTRMITDIMTREGIVSKTFLVNNQTDGGGEVGRLRVSQAKDDGHLLLTFNSGDLLPMVQNTDNRIENFKPITILAVDRQLLLKGEKTKYNTFLDAVEAAKSGTKVVIAGSKGDDLSTYQKMLASLGLTEDQMSYMMHDATSDALTSLLGGHVDFCIGKPAASMQYIDSGDMEPVLALSTAHFGGSLADVPLLSEIGDYKNVESPVWRGVVAPKSMPDEAVQFWSDALKAVSESEAWQKDYIEKNLLTSMFLDHNEAQAYMADYQEQCLAS